MKAKGTSQTFVTVDYMSKLGYFCYLGLVIAYLMFIFAASFYGIDLDVVSVEKGKEKLFFSSIHVLTPSFHNLRDIATNVLLYMPLGFFWCAAIISKGRKAGKRYWFVGLVVSLIVEIVQAFVGRHSDVVDIVSNSGGFVTGFTIMNIAVKQFHLKPSHLLGVDAGTTQGALQTFAGLRFIFMAVVYVVSLLPLNISVAFSNLVAQLTIKEGQLHPKIILDPFFHIETQGQFFHSLLLKLLVFVPLAFFTYSISANRPLIKSKVIMHCLMFAVFVELSKIFVLSATTDISVIILSPLVAYVVCLILDKSNVGRGNVDGKNVSKPDSSGTSVDLFVGVLPVGLYLLFLIVLTFSPYGFEITASEIKAKFFESNFIPFKFHFTNRSISGAIDIAREFLIYVPLGVLAFPVVLRVLRANVLLALMVCAVLASSFALLMELSQLVVIGRYVDITDPMLATAGVVFGVFFRPLIVRLFKREA